MAFAYVTLPFLVFAINALLAALVARSEWKSKIHRAFAWFLLAMASWGLLIFGMRSSPDLERAYVWERFVLIAIALTSLLFYRFTVLFAKVRVSTLETRLLYGLTIASATLSLAGFVATGMQEKFYGYAPVLGPAFPLYLLASYMPLFFAFKVLFSQRKRVRNSDERLRVDYLIVAAALSVLGGTTDFLPALGLHLYPMGVVMNIAFGTVATIAITRHHLLDLRLVLGRGFLYFLISTAIFSIYGAIIALFFCSFRMKAPLPGCSQSSRASSWSLSFSLLLLFALSVL